MQTAEKIIVSDVDEVARAAASRTAYVLRERELDGVTPTLVLTGGTAGVRTAGALADEDVPWSLTRVYFGDERFLEKGDPERNDTQLDDALFSRLRVRPEMFPWPHRVPGEFEDVDAAAAMNVSTIPGFGDDPFFDVHLLGMGGEGHVNSIFPDSPQVAEEIGLVSGVRDCPKPPPERVTYTLPAVRRSRHVFLVVAGKDKAEAVARAFSGEETPASLPAVGATGSESTVWFLDEAAASLLD